MTTWQSFFNQLSKPVNINDSTSILNKLCHCDEGSLSFNGDDYHHQGKCSLNLVCCAIQIDKHRVYAFNNGLTISERVETALSGKNDSNLFSLDTILDR
ncbi:MAG: hypothetical protein JSW11_06020 [Candidatus Heimdallarchaeota archaeon]|nr:MAG: hypothetical protein JSW11_06020 [Candidatus Heimdallarchaeota archaeon]